MPGLRHQMGVGTYSGEPSSKAARVWLDVLKGTGPLTPACVYSPNRFRERVIEHELGRCGVPDHAGFAHHCSTYVRLNLRYRLPSRLGSRRLPAASYFTSPGLALCTGPEDLRPTLTTRTPISPQGTPLCLGRQTCRSLTPTAFPHASTTCSDARRISFGGSRLRGSRMGSNPTRLYASPLR